MVDFSPADFSAAVVTVSAAVSNIGLMPWSGTGVRVTFTLVAASGSQTAIGWAAAPAVLQSGELVNVSVSWTMAAGASGVVRVALEGNRDTNATNDVVSALPARIGFDPSSIGLWSPGDRVMLVADVNSIGPGAANIIVEVRAEITQNDPHLTQVWSAQASQHPSDAVLVTTVPLALRPSLSSTLSAALSTAQQAAIGNYVRLDVVWQGAVQASQVKLLGSSAYDFALDMRSLEVLSADHAHLRVGVPVLSHGLRAAAHVPVTASVLNDDGSTELLATAYVAWIAPGGNVSVLVAFTVPRAGPIQIQFEVNPVMGGSGGSRLLAEVWTHDNAADRTFVTRAAADGASWSSSAAGHAAAASFSSAGAPQTLGAASGGFTAGLPAHQVAAAFGESAASSASTHSSSSEGSSSGRSSSSSEMSSAAASSGSQYKPAHSHYSSSSGLAAGFRQSGVVAIPASSSSSSAEDSSTSSHAPSSSVAQTEILAIVPTNADARIVLAGNPVPVSYAAVVSAYSVVSRVDFVYAGVEQLSSTRSGSSFVVELPAHMDNTATLMATAFDASGVQVSSLSASVPVLTLPPWFLALRPAISRESDGAWEASAVWSAALRGGVMSALSGSSLVDVEVLFDDAMLDLEITVKSTGFTSLHGAGQMTVRVKVRQLQLPRRPFH